MGVDSDGWYGVILEVLYHQLIGEVDGGRQDAASRERALVLARRG